MKLTVCKAPNGAVALRSDRGQVCEMLAGYDQTRQQDAQAIAHRVNVHDELVAALADCNKVLSALGCDITGKSNIAEAARKARTALEKAKQ